MTTRHHYHRTAVISNKTTNTQLVESVTTYIFAKSLDKIRVTSTIHMRAVFTERSILALLLTNENRITLKHT